MEIQLLAIDLDGTLLNSAKRIGEATIRAVAAARGCGVQVALASARPPRTTLPFHRQLDLDTPMINYNGALVYDPLSNRILMHRPLPLTTARRIIELARGVYPRVLVSAEILDRWYTDRLDPAHATETARLVEPDRIAPIPQWLTEHVTKLLLLGDPQRLLEVAAAVRTEFLHQVSMVQTEGNLVQITHATVSKAQALRVVAAELAISREQVMAIGDNLNDVEMLQWAGVSAAMANGSPAAIAVADFVTGSHDEDGVAEAIRRVILKN